MALTDAATAAPAGPPLPGCAALAGLTVAICTRDRPELLARALSSLRAQTHTPTEVLVVDNAPADSGTARLVADRFPDIRYVVEPVPGLDFARNRALREARAPIVAFLDDDAVAEAGWAGALAAAFDAYPAAGCCTGRVEALTLDTEGQRTMEANGGYDRGTVRVRLPADAQRQLHGRRVPLIAWAVSVGSGCSLAVRRDLALRLGGFDEALDMGAVLPGGGDHDMLWRTLAAGAEVVYEPAALARHEHRRELAAAYDQIVGHQRALVAFLTKAAVRGRWRSRPGVVTFLGWRLVKPALRLLRRMAGRDPLPAAVLLRMLGACWAGLVAYPRARRIAAARRRAAPRGRTP